MPNFVKWYNEKGESEKGRNLRNEQRTRYYAKTGIYERREWTLEEIELVLAHEIPDMELSKKIQRSVKAIQLKRCRSKKEDL